MKIKKKRKIEGRIYNEKNKEINIVKRNGYGKKIFFERGNKKYRRKKTK
jgi:hypothetical protein